MKPENMDVKALKRLFIKKLGFWSLHGTISALPGFFCALMIFDSSADRKLAAVFPMLAAIVTCAIALAGLFTFLEARKPLNALVSKGMTAGLRIRILMVVAGLVILAASDSVSYKGLMLVPDVWIGLAAALTNYWICKVFGIESGIDDLANGAVGGFGFGTIYALSMTVALIVALMIFIVSFIATLVIQMRMRKSVISGQGACPAHLRNYSWRR